MVKDIKYSDGFFKSLNSLTGIPMRKIQAYAKENNPFNILEHPMVLDPSEKQMDKINKLNEFISNYSLLKIEEEQSKVKFASPKDAGRYFVSLLGGMRDKERFLVSFLDNSNSIIETRTVSEGSVGMAVVYPRDILKMAIANDCSRIMLSHNHPGGSTSPSMEDKDLTQKIVDIFHPLDIKVIDHIIVGGSQFSSMAEDHYLPDMKLHQANYDPIQLKKHEMIQENEYDYVTDIEEEIEISV